MRFLHLQSALALSSALGSQALPRASADQLEPTKRDFNGKNYDAKSNCKAWDDQDDATRLWHDSLAGVVGDDFINENGVANWPQKLDRAIFDEPQNSWYCRDQSTECFMDKSCREFADKGVEGAHYLYLSLQNAIGVLRSMRDYLAWNTIKQSLNVPQITEDFRRQASDAEPNVLVLIAATFGMLGGIAAPVAPVAGTFGFTSGMFAFLGNVNPPKPDETKNFEGKLADMVQKGFEMTEKKIDDIINALVGVEGYDQSLIPKEMTRQSFDNAVINAFGDGQWLNDDPGANIREIMDGAHILMKQHLAWTMIRYGRMGFYFVDSGVDKGKCGDGDNDHPDEFWDDNANGCVKLMEILKKTREDTDMDYIPADVLDKLFGNNGDYDLDVKKSFQNAWDCWTDSHGKVGSIDLENHDFSDRSALPKCWFGLPVVRGSKKESKTSPDFINIDDEYVNGGNGGRWYGGIDDDHLTFGYD